MSSSANNTQGSGRGPAPPLPEKPPSVAERTRLLKSSFRKDEVEKPKIIEKHSSPIVERAATVPPTNVINSSTNGEKSETPSPAGSVNSMSSVGRYNNDKMMDSNRETSQNQSAPGVSIHMFDSHLYMMMVVAVLDPHPCVRCEGRVLFKQVKK